MIIKDQKQIEILGDENEKSIKMGLDLESAQILMNLLSKDLYSDPIGSTIREVASNALDSHRKAGVEEPILVSLTLSGDDSANFIVEDFGVGLDDEDVENIISKYGKSMKRNDANALGMMGLGFKAPLSYSSVFYFEGFKNGIRRKYMMYEGEDGNRIDLLYEREILEEEKESGVIVTVPVQRKDWDSFSRSMKSQLAYFESVVMEINSKYTTWNNRDVKIFRHALFQHSSLYRENKLHLTLDNVYYPIDFTKLGIKEIEVPIAIRVSLTDGVYPTPNRESIKYTPDTINFIKSKIEDIEKWMLDKWNSKYDIESENFMEVLEDHNNTPTSIDLLDSFDDNSDNGVFIDLTNFPNIGSKDLKRKRLKGCPDIELNINSTTLPKIMRDFDIRYVLKSGTISRVKRVNESKWSFYNPQFSASGEIRVIIVPEKFNEKLKSYIRYNFNYSTYVIASHNGFPDKLNLRDFLRSFRSKYDLQPFFPEPISLKEGRRQLLTARNMLIKAMYDLRDIKFSDDFEKMYQRRYKRSTASVERREGEIPVKYARRMKVSIPERCCKFEPGGFDLSKIEITRNLIIYSSHEQKDDMESLYGVFCNRYRPTLITTSPREIKKLDEIKSHNLLSLETFMQGKNRRFSKLATAIYIKHNVVSKYDHLFTRSDVLEHYDKRLAEKCSQVYNYADSKLGTLRKYYDTILSKMLEERILEYALENNLLDESIMYLVRDLEKTLEKLYFIDEFAAITRLGKEDMGVRVLRDLFMYHKHRPNYTMFTK